MDAIGTEPQFLDHLAPVWLALPGSVRGRFLVDPALADRARAKGIEPTTIDAMGLRNTPQQPPNRDGKPALVASIGDIKVARRMGYGPFAYLEHGAGQAYGTGNDATASYAGGPDREDNELFLVPSESCAASWRKAYPQARVEVVGCPKLDTLPRREPGPRPTVAVSFHWPAPLSVSGFAGTAVGEYGPVLGELAKRFNVIGHSHPNWRTRRYPDTPGRFYQQAGIPFVEDFEDVCRQADVYVCDNSSTIWEFASTGRPVVLMNARQWSRKVNLGLRFWDAAEVGINVDRPADLGVAVVEALTDPPERQVAREAALQIVYGLRTNGATAAATAITDWLASRDIAYVAAGQAITHRMAAHYARDDARRAE